MRTITPSKLSGFFRCGEQYRRLYVENERRPPGIAAHKGGAVHKGAEMDYTHRIKDPDTLPPEQDVIDAAVAEYDARLNREGALFTAEETSKGVETVIGEQRDRVVVVTGIVHREIAPTVQPDFVEEMIEIPLANDITLRGRLDLSTIQRLVTDLKITSKGKREADAWTDLQLSFYAMLYQYRTGVYPSAVGWDNVVDAKTPKINLIRVARNDQDTIVLLRMVNAMIAAEKAGNYLPAAPGSWVCSDNWCGFYNDCKFVRRRG